MKTLMKKNWELVCTTLQLAHSAKKELDGFQRDVHVLQVIQKNIYHKQPQCSPITFAKVCAETNHNIRVRDSTQQHT